MDRLLNNPGLSHLALEIFEYLDKSSLLKSRLVCKSWNQFIEDELTYSTKIEYWKSQASWKTDSFFFFWPEWIDIFDKIHSIKHLRIFYDLFDMYFQQQVDCNLSPIHFAAKQGNAEFMELAMELIWPYIEEKGHQSIDYGLNPLHLAVESGNLDIVKMLVEKYKCVDQPNHRQMKPLHFAASAGFPEIFQFLYENTEDKNPKDCYGQTPLHLAALQENPEFLELLIGIYGKNVDVEDNDGNSPLHYSTGNYKIFQIVYQYAQNKQPKNHKGQTPLDWKSAPDYSDPQVIKFLKKKYKCKSTFSLKKIFRMKKRNSTPCQLQESHNLFAEEIPNQSNEAKFSTLSFSVFENGGRFT